MPDARINVPASVARGKAFEVRVLIRHPMETGYRMDDGGKAVPRNVIRTFTCRYNGEVVFSARLSSGIAANPYLRFFVNARDSGPLTIEWLDDGGARGSESVAVNVGLMLLRALVGAIFFVATAAGAEERALPLSSLRSGIEFSGADVRSMQGDDAANPGMLWIERGEKLWNAVSGAADRSCASCHGTAASSMRGVATRYPQHDKATGKLFDLEARIGDCRTRRQQASALQRESDDLLALAAYVGYQSRGLPMAVAIDDTTRAAFERGRTFYYQRHGQMNMECAQCHEQNWGKRLLRETLSQGHGTAFPAYRLEWQGLGSLQRRIRACLFGIRAEMPPPGAEVLTEIELFLAWRAEGLPLETPGVRR